MAERSTEVDQISQKLEVQRSNYEWQLSCINNADSKAGFLVTINLALLGFTFARIDAMLTVSSSGAISTKSIALVVFLVFSTLLSLFFATKAIWPRFSKDINSIFYYISVHKRTKEQYSEEIQSSEMTSILDDLDKQVWVLSGIAEDKFMNIRTSIVIYFIGMLSLIVLYVSRTANG
jgi:hypothetical protein